MQVCEKCGYVDCVCHLDNYEDEEEDEDEPEPFDPGGFSMPSIEPELRELKQWKESKAEESSSSE